MKEIELKNIEEFSRKYNKNIENKKLEKKLKNTD